MFLIFEFSWLCPDIDTISFIRITKHKGYNLLPNSTDRWANANIDTISPLDELLKENISNYARKNPKLSQKGYDNLGFIS
jgi:hypothetical protein